VGSGAVPGHNWGRTNHLHNLIGAVWQLLKCGSTAVELRQDQSSTQSNWGSLVVDYISQPQLNRLMMQVGGISRSVVSFII